MIGQAHTVLNGYYGDEHCSNLIPEELRLFELKTLLPIIATALRRRAEATGRCQRAAGRVLLLVNSLPVIMCFLMCTLHHAAISRTCISAVWIRPMPTPQA